MSFSNSSYTDASRYGARRGPTIQVPHRLTTFIGRDEEVATLQQALRDGRRLITVLGLGGMGKTRLVQEVAHTDIGRSFRGIWFCELATETDPAELCQSIAESMGVPISSNRPFDSLAHTLSGIGSIVLILDGAEPVLDAVGEFVQTLLSRTPEVHFLVTSQRPLGLDGEMRVQLAPLGGSGVPESIADHAGVHLFWERATTSGAPLPEKSAETDRQILALVNELGGLPLAIEMAAGQLHSYGIPEMTQQIRASFDFLKSRRRDIQSRHETLEGVFDWSWGLLAPYERVALAQLSVFIGPFTVAQAVAVVDVSAWGDAPAVADILARLLESAFVSVDTLKQTRIFWLLPPVFRWAANKLDGLVTASSSVQLSGCVVDLETGEGVSGDERFRLNPKENALLRQLAAHPNETLLREDLLEQVWGYSGGIVTRTLDTTMRTLRRKVDRDQNHLKTARGVGYFFVPGAVPSSARLEAEERHGRLYTRLSVAEWKGYLDRSSAAKRAAKRDDGGMLLDLLENMPLSTSYFTSIPQLLAEVQRLHSEPALRPQIWRVKLLRLVGRLDEAREVLAAAKGLLKERPITREHVHFYHTDILVNGSLVGIQASIERIREGLALAERCHAPKLKGSLLGMLSNRLLRAGDLEGFEALIASRLDRTDLRPHETVAAQVEYGRLLIWRGEYERAEQLFTRAVERAESSLGDILVLWARWALLRCRHQAAEMRGEVDGVAGVIRDMMELAKASQETEHHILIADGLVDLAFALLNSNRSEEALRYLEAAEFHGRKVSMAHLWASVDFGLAWHAVQVGRGAVANQYLERGFGVLKEEDDLETRIQGHLVEARAGLAVGDADMAQSALQAAERQLQILQFNPSNFTYQCFTELKEAAD